MKKIIAAILLPMLLIGFTFLPACKNRSAVKEKKAEELKQVEKVEDQIEVNVYEIPSSAEVIKMLTELEVGYIFGISNPVANAKKYFSSTDRAINLGVFGADLSYATLYNMEQQVRDYLDAIRAISNELNMSQIYKEELYDDMKKNFDNRDELVRILTGTFNETYAYLSENDQQVLALLVAGGAWVEGMYLTTHVSEAAYQVAGISRVLIEQKQSFELFLELTQPYNTDPSIAEFLRTLDPIKKVYEGLTTSLTEQNIKDITGAISTIRAKIVQ